MKSNVLRGLICLNLNNGRSNYVQLYIPSVLPKELCRELRGTTPHNIRESYFERGSKIVRLLSLFWKYYTAGICRYNFDFSK